MLLQKDTYRQQSDLASYCRTNKLSNELKVRTDKVHHYRRLVYNIIDDSLQSAFPLTYNLLDENEWEKLVEIYFSTHKSQSAQVWRMPEEFYLFWKEKQDPIHEKYPFLNDLLFLEWIEIEIFMMEDKEYPPYTSEGNINDETLAINPEHKIIHVHYPVHLKNAGQILKDNKDDFYILIFREQESGKVQFMDISPFYTLLIENLLSGLTLKEILTEVKNKLPNTNSDDMLKNSIHFIDILKEKKFILGYHKK